MVAEPMDAFEPQHVSEDTAGDTATLNLPQAEPDFRFGRQAGMQARGFPAARTLPPGGRLAEAIEAALVPRLVLAHGVPPGPIVRAGDPALRAEAEGFAALLIADDDACGAMAMLHRLRAGGTSVEALCLDMLAPAARRLGAMWEEDDCDFATVTLGLSRLHRALHELSPDHASVALPPDPRRTAVLAVTPGEQHVFGLSMVGEFLRRAGWEVSDAIGASQAELTQVVRRGWFAVAALSTSRESGLDPLAATITAIRAASRHREIAVLVGGHPFADQPGNTLRVGADATASDARAAVTQAERLLARAEPPRAIR
jgi:methanogenic corrinoid protein MtbC1